MPVRPVHRAGRRRVFRHAAPAVLWFVLWATFVAPGCARRGAEPAPEAFVVRISDLKTGVVYAQVPARPGSVLFFGWIHSLEKIPWNEYFHVDEAGGLILDSITFPAFGAGIPADKGRVCYIRDGLIHMEGIDQVFPELIWLNSRTAVQDILLDGALVARGRDLPHHTRLRLAVAKR